MMAPGTIQLDPIGFGMRFLHVVRLMLASVARFFFALYYGSEGEKIPPIKDEIIKLPAIVIAKMIRDKETTSVEVLEAYIRRIKDVNSALNCFVEDRFEEALKEAREADAIIQSGEVDKAELARGKPLLGVPFTTKDCIAVKGLHNTAGVVLRKDVIAFKDAEAIKLLRDKGAIIIGLTNVSELCMWWESHNHIYGRSKNAYNTTRIVGGSSGGEGCLQSAAGSAFGIGSDIGGSIRMPAFFNGVFGHKPSRNTVSNIGQYPKPVTVLQQSFLGIGPITRNAIDLKPLLAIIAGDNAEKLDLDKPVDINQLKVFYQFENGAPLTDRVDPEIKGALKKVIEFLQQEHKINAQEKNIDVLRETNDIWLALMKNDGDSFGKMIMGKESILLFFIEMVKNFIGFSGNTLIAIFTAMVDDTGVRYGSLEYKHYKTVRDQVEAIFDKMLGNDGVFLYPTHPTPAPYHNEPILRPMNFSYTAIINCLGLPSTHIPLGLSKEGLPIGIQVVANHNNDRLCLAVAEELDKAFGGWVEPQKGN